MKRLFFYRQSSSEFLVCSQDIYRANGPALMKRERLTCGLGLTTAHNVLQFPTFREYHPLYCRTISAGHLHSVALGCLLCSCGHGSGLSYTHGPAPSAHLEPVSAERAGCLSGSV